MTLTFTIPRKLETLRAKKFNYREKRFCNMAIHKEQQAMMLTLRHTGKAGGVEQFLKAAKGKVLCNAVIYRRRLIRDRDNWESSFNKFVVDGFVNSKWLSDDNSNIIESKVEQVQDKNERIEITLAVHP